jgi:hypothetical protein
MSAIDLYTAYLIAAPFILAAAILVSVKLSVFGLFRCSGAVAAKTVFVQSYVACFYPLGLSGGQPYFMLLCVWSLAAFCVSIKPAEVMNGVLGWTMVPVIIGAGLMLYLGYGPNRDWLFWSTLMTSAVAELVILTGWAGNETGKYILARFGFRNRRAHHAEIESGNPR